MKVITESFLRETFRKEIPKTFILEKGQIMTPSARQLLSEKRVKIVTGKEEAEVKKPEKAVETFTPVTGTKKYLSASDGGMFETKPEHMTQLNGNRLVPKDNRRIVFRGKMESLEAMILITRLDAHEKGAEKLVKDLDEIFGITKAVIRADLNNEALLENRILGLDGEEIRKQCKDPKKYFGVDHVDPGVDMGKIALGLNLLRTCIREAEVMAVQAFRSEFELEKPDIIHALNMMSSALFIMMAREKAGKYL